MEVEKKIGKHPASQSRDDSDADGRGRIEKVLKRIEGRRDEIRLPCMKLWEDLWEKEGEGRVERW